MCAACPREFFDASMAPEIGLKSVLATLRGFKVTPPPAAMPAERVRMPAPATLFTICSTNEGMLLPDFSASFLLAIRLLDCSCGTWRSKPSAGASISITVAYVATAGSFCRTLFKCCSIASIDSVVMYTPRGQSGTGGDLAGQYPVEPHRYGSLAQSARTAREAIEREDAEARHHRSEWLAGRESRLESAV